MSQFTDTQLQRRLDNISPGAKEAHLGSTVYDLLNAYNDLRRAYVALLAKLDAANVTGLGNNNGSVAGPAIAAVKLPSQR